MLPARACSPTSRSASSRSASRTSSRAASPSPGICGGDRGAVQGKGAAALRQGGQHLAPRPPLSAFFDNAAISALAHQLMPGPVPMWEDQMVYKLPTTRRRPWLGTDYTSWDHVGQLIGHMLDRPRQRHRRQLLHAPGSHLWPMRYAREDSRSPRPPTGCCAKRGSPPPPTSPPFPARSRPGTATSTTAAPSTAPTATAPTTRAAATLCTSCPATPGAEGTTGTSGWGTWRRRAWGGAAGPEYPELLGGRSGWPTMALVPLFRSQHSLHGQPSWRRFVNR